MAQGSAVAAAAIQVPRAVDAVHERPVRLARPTSLLKACQYGKGPGHPVPSGPFRSALPLHVRRLTVTQASPVLAATSCFRDQFADVPSGALLPDAVAASLLLAPRRVAVPFLGAVSLGIATVRTTGLREGLARRCARLGAVEDAGKVLLHVAMTATLVTSAVGRTLPCHALLQALDAHPRGVRH